MTMKRKMLGLFLVLAIMVGCVPNVVWATTGNDIASVAWNYLGVSRDVYDCSAFTQKVYSDCGISIPRLTYDQANCGTRIYSRDVNDLKPGDIICFGSSSNSSDISHVGIYVGNNVVLHSSYSKWQIAQDNMSNWITTGWYSPPYQFAVRVVSGDTTPPTNPKLQMYDKLVPAGVPVCFEYSCNNADRMYIAIDVDGVREHFIEVSGDHYNGTFTKPGHYEAALYAYNSAGESGFSNWVSFDVYNSKPSNCRLVADKLTGMPNEPIKLTMSANYAVTYSLHIYRNNINIYNYENIKNGKNENYVLKFPEPGTYKVYTTAYNYFDLCQSTPIYITIDKPTTDYPFTVQKSTSYVTITNNTNEAKKACVILALYNGGTLTDTKVYNTTISPDSPMQLNVHSSDYKVFVWDSLSGMKPLSE